MRRSRELPRGGLTTPTFEELIADGAAPVPEIARRLRDLLRSRFPGSVEQIDLGNRVAAYGTSERMRDIAFAIAPHSAHVNLQLADGVDLYDRRYFWLAEDQPRGDDPAIGSTHATALAGIVATIGDWSQRLQARGIRVFVHNPRSLLTQVLPVWSSAEGDARASSP